MGRRLAARLAIAALVGAALWGGRAAAPGLATASADVTVAAVGDIACDPMDPDFNGGAGQNGHCMEQATANLISAGGYADVLPLGDLQYDCGTLYNFLHSYDLAYGAWSATDHPVPGNHEYDTSSVYGEPGCSAAADGYYQYFAQKGNTAAAGASGKGYYSYSLGTWHVIALNSNCSKIGGCSATSAEYKWLAQDLSSNPSTCTLAYWHHAAWSSKGKAEGVHAMRAIWAKLASSGADVVLAGHFHHYERFADMNASGAAVADGAGMREIVVGTGGEGLGGFNSTPLPASQVRNSSTFGILALTLGAGTYSWSFVPAGSAKFTDSGSDSCH
jgi:hypothetical protein